MVDLIQSDTKDLRLRYNQEAGDVVTNTLESSIRESILNILNTATSERLFNRGFGSDLKYFLFEILSDLNAALLKERVIIAINRQEPRVSVSNKTLIIANDDENRYDIFLTLRLVETGEVFQFDTFIRRVVG